MALGWEHTYIGDGGICNFSNIEGHTKIDRNILNFSNTLFFKCCCSKFTCMKVYVVWLCCPILSI